MATISALVRLLLAVLAAVIARAARRLVRGPVVPSWSWHVEMRVVALRAFIMAGDLPETASARRWAERRWDPKPPRSLRGLVRVEPARLGGCPGEWIVRNDSGVDLTDSAVMLYLHGGGYMVGSPATHRDFVTRLTWATHARTFVLDYRLAPRHPFPAAVEDALSAYEALIAGGWDPASLILAGDSAGGGLACAVMLALRDTGRPLPAGALLFSPYTDLTHSGASIPANLETDYLPIRPIRPNLEYLGDADPLDPLASPLYGDYRDLPPLLVFAGGREMILDDSIRLAAKARSAGTDVTVHVEADMFHVWPAIVPNHPASRRALAMSAEFVMAHANPPSIPGLGARNERMREAPPG